MLDLRCMVLTVGAVLCAVNCFEGTAAQVCAPAPCLSYATDGGDIVAGDTQLQVSWNVPADLSVIHVILGQLEADAIAIARYDTGQQVLNHTIKNPATTGMFTWDVPYVRGSNFELIVQIGPDLADKDSFGSGPTFRLIAPSNEPVVLTPEAGNLLIPGEELNVAWRDFEGNNVQVLLTYYDPEEDAIKVYPRSLFGSDSTPNDGEENFVLPSAATSLAPYVHNIRISDGTNSMSRGPLYVPRLLSLIQDPLASAGQAISGATRAPIAYGTINFVQDIRVSISNATTEPLVVGTLPSNFEFDTSTVPELQTSSFVFFFNATYPTGEVTIRLFVDDVPALVSEQQITVLPPCDPGTFYNSTSVACEPCPTGTFSNATNREICTQHSTCLATEVQVLPGTTSSDTVCINAAVPVAFSASSPPGLLLDSPLIPANMSAATTTQAVAAIASHTTATRVRAALGNKAAGADVVPPQPQAQATRLRAVLLGEPGVRDLPGSIGEPTVYADDNRVEVLLFALDDHGVPVRNTPCHVRLQDDASSLTAINGSCTTSSSSDAPSCTVSLPLSDNAFFTTTRRLILSAGLTDPPTEQVFALRTAPHVSAPEPLTGDVLVEFPQQVMPRGEPFTFTVSAHGGARPLSSWQVRITVGAAADVQLQSVTGGDGWTVTPSSLPSPDAAVLGVRALGEEEGGNDGGGGAEVSVLFTGEIVVGDNAADEVVINVTVAEAFDSAGQPVLDGQQPLVVAASNPNTSAHRSSSVLLRTYSPSTLVALQPLPSVRSGSGSTTTPLSSILLNTAALHPDQAAISHPLTVRGYSAAGAGSVLQSSMLACTSNNTAALAVETACSHVSFTGAEVEGGGSVTVTVEHTASSLRTSLAYVVWFPHELRLALHGGSQLYRVAATSLFTHTAYTVEADWSALSAAQVAALGGDMSSSNSTLAGTDVTSLVWPLITANSSSTDQSGTGAVSVTRSSITANATGQYTLCIRHRQRLPNAGCLASRVLDASASERAAIAIHAVVVADVALPSITAGPGACPSRVACKQVAAKYTSVLTADRQRASVIVRAVLDDGDAATPATTLTLDPDLHNISLSSSSPTLLATSSGEGANAAGTSAASFPFITTLGGGAFPITVQWNAPDSPTALSTTVNVTSDLPAVQGVRIASLPSQLAPETDLSADLPSGLASSADVSIFLLYDDGTELDFTADARTVVATQGNITATLQPDDTLRVSVVPGSTGGEATLTVSFEHTDHSDSVQVELVVASTLHATLRPYPSFPGSGALTVGELRRLGATEQWQQAQLDVDVGLSSGATVTGNAHPELSVLAPAFLGHMDGSYVLSPMPKLPAHAGEASINVTLRHLAATAVVNVSSASWRVSSIDPILSTTLAGTRGSTRQVRASVVMENGLTLPSDFLFPGGSPLALKGLLTFHIVSEAMALPSGIELNGTTGTATLVGNSRQQEAVVVRAGNDDGVNATAHFYVNLQPNGFDVDLGGTSQLPLAPVAPGEDVVIPVRVRLPSLLSFASLSLQVTFDASALDFVQVAEGSDWPGGDFAGGLRQPGLISFGGSTSDVVGMPTLFEVTLRANASASPGIVAISGVAVTIADGDSTLLADNATFVAGSVTLEITQGSRRRRNVGVSSSRDGGLGITAAAAAAAAANSAQMQPSSLSSRSLPPAAHGRTRRAACDAPPCAECTGRGRQLGDADGNCVFDVRDVTFLKRFLNEKLLDPTGAFVTSVQTFQESQMDADGNTLINTVDVNFLLRANFGLFSFVRNVTMAAPAPEPALAVSMEQTECSIAVHVSALSGGDGTAQTPTDPSRLAVFVYFDSPNVTLHNSTLLVAPDSDVVVADAATNQSGVLVRAEHSAERNAFVAAVSSELAPGVVVTAVPMLISIDAAGDTSTDRATAALTFSEAPLRIPGMQEVAFTFLGRRFELVLNNYGPRVWVATSAVSRHCREQLTCDNDAQAFVFANATTTDNPLCRPLTPCVLGDTYETRAPTQYTDRICTNTTACVEGEQYRAQNATLTSDRMCTNITAPCDLQVEFEAEPPTPTSDRLCTNITAPCDMHVEFEAEPPTPTSDRVCTALRQCTASEFESLKPTPTSNRVCMANPCNLTSICLPDGSCIPTPYGVYCECPDGVDCGPQEPPTTNLCNETVCGDGTCVSTSNGTFCVCSDGDSNCAPTTPVPSPDSSSNAAVDASLVIIITMCSFFGLVLLVVIFLIARRSLRNRRKDASTPAGPGVQVFEQEGLDTRPGGGSSARMSAVELQRQPSLRTKEDVESFQPVLLGRMESVEETEFEGDVMEEGRPTRPQHGDKGTYQDVPRHRLTRNPTYREGDGDNQEPEYAEVGPGEKAPGGGHEKLPHKRLTRSSTYKRPSSALIEPNRYEDITPVVSRQQSLADDDDASTHSYDLPRKDPKEATYESVNGAASRQPDTSAYHEHTQADKPEYAEIGAVGPSQQRGPKGIRYDLQPYEPEVIAYEELPGKSRRSSMFIEAGSAQSTPIERRRSSRVVKLSDEVLRDPERDVFFVRVNDETKRLYGDPAHTFKAVRAQGAANEVLLMPSSTGADGADNGQQQIHGMSENPAYFDPRPTPQKQGYFDPRPTPPKPEYAEAHAPSEGVEYADPQALAPQYNKPHHPSGDEPTYSLPEDVMDVPGQGEYMEMPREALLCNPDYASYADLEQSTTSADDNDDEPYLTIVPSS